MRGALVLGFDGVFSETYFASLHGDHSDHSIFPTAEELLSGRKNKKQETWKL